MQLSNYPPGVTGLEPMITGEGEGPARYEITVEYDGEMGEYTASLFGTYEDGESSDMIDSIADKSAVDALHLLASYNRAKFESLKNAV